MADNGGFDSAQPAAASSKQRPLSGAETTAGKPYVVMGIVNVTDDSFYDGGSYVTKDAAVEHALRLVEDGADVIDIGGCSSRPGAKFLPPEDEAERVVPVVSELVKRG